MSMEIAECPRCGSKYRAVAEADGRVFSVACAMCYYVFAGSHKIWEEEE